MAVVAIMLCGASFLAFFAGERSGDSWGYSASADSAGEIPSRFVVVDMSRALAAIKGVHGDEEEPTGIGPIPSDPMYQEGEIILEEVSVEDDPVPLSKQGMDEGDLDDSLGLDELKSGSRSEKLASRLEQSPGKVDAMEGVTLDEVSIVWKEHSVKPGETLFVLAQNSNLSQKDIIKANELKNPDRLSLGQVLLIPRSHSDVNATLDEVRRRRENKKAKEDKVVPFSTKTYKVQNGDSLWSISNKFNVTIDTLFSANSLSDPDKLKPGMTLKVPNQDGVFYKVRKGDTLGKIASAYSVDINRIVDTNGIEQKKLISVGQELFLPGASQVAGSYSRPASRSGSVSRSSRSFRWPVVGRINSPFGWRRHPISKRRSFHTGVDIKASRHTRIRAARSGRVVYAGWMGGYGRVVVVKHDSTYSTLYAHCQKLYVRKGQKVSAGKVVATVGTSGRSTGPHLHFEIRINNKPVNPLKYLR